MRGRVTSSKSAPDFSIQRLGQEGKAIHLYNQVKFQQEPRGTGTSLLPVTFISNLDIGVPTLLNPFPHQSSLAHSWNRRDIKSYLLEIWRCS